MIGAAAVEDEDKVWQSSKENERKNKRGLGERLDERARTRWGDDEVLRSWSRVVMRNMLLSPVINMTSVEADEELKREENSEAETGPDT